jgi:hypothetical protein
MQPANAEPTPACAALILICFYQPSSSLLPA